MVNLVGFFSDHKKKLREDLQKKLESVADLELEGLDVDLEDIFDSLGDTFDSLGDTFDSIIGIDNGDRQDEERGQRTRMQAALAADRERLKADMKKMKKDLKKSMPRGKGNIQSGGKKSNNISVSGNDSLSISGAGGGFSVKVGDMSVKNHKHSLTIRDVYNDSITKVTYFDDKNFKMINDEQSGTFNDDSLMTIKKAIRADIKLHKNQTNEARPPPPKPQMPPNESFSEFDIFSESNLRKATESFHDPIFLKRTWGGESGLPIEFDESAKITVSGHNAFGRKYEVKINGTAIYVPTIENLMDYCYIGDHLDAFIEMRSPAEKVILLKIIDGLIALKIAEPHHTGVKELL